MLMVGLYLDIILILTKFGDGFRAYDEISDAIEPKNYLKYPNIICTNGNSFGNIFKTKI